MSVHSRLTQALASADVMPYNDQTKFIIMSDLHRGDNSWADDFAHNQYLQFYALQKYFEEGFIYIELGDGFELWENRNIETIKRSHDHIFWQLRQFHEADRLRIIWGNHDMELSRKEYVREHLSMYYNDNIKQDEPLFDNITITESVILEHQNTGQRLFLVHGHQGDFFGDTAWRLGRWLVRYVWRPLQLLGFHDPTSPARNYEKASRAEHKYIQWIKEKDTLMVAGHTHRAALPVPGKVPYFNTGSGVHPRCITGIEIRNNEIQLVKWWVTAGTDGRLTIEQKILAGPEKISEYATV